MIWGTVRLLCLKCFNCPRFYLKSGLLWLSYLNGCLVLQLQSQVETCFISVEDYHTAACFTSVTKDTANTLALIIGVTQTLFECWVKVQFQLAFFFFLQKCGHYHMIISARSPEFRVGKVGKTFDLCRAYLSWGSLAWGGRLLDAYLRGNGSWLDLQTSALRRKVS